MSRPMAQSRASREAALMMTYPSKHGPYELKVIEEPENQHRARYQTEGSRGAIKDQSQQGFPQVQVRANIYIELIRVSYQYII